MVPTDNLNCLESPHYEYTPGKVKCDYKWNTLSCIYEKNPSGAVDIIEGTWATWAIF